MELEWFEGREVARRWFGRGLSGLGAESELSCCHADMKLLNDKRKMNVIPVILLDSFYMFIFILY